tara:strand:+ start:11130 stop:12029 length:900 start_codon:yes stop_codon:yes gene_type:complete
MLYREAISQSIVDAMERDPKVLLLGEMVQDPKGVFNTTLEAAQRFPDRVIETPISETMITGACVGLAMEGWKPILVHARADFSLLSFEHLINTAAKIPFLHGKPLPFVMRVLVGRGWGQGPVHSQSFHQMLAQVPGLNVVVPSMGSRYGICLDIALHHLEGPTVIVEPRRLYDSSLTLHDFRNEGPTDIAICPIGDTIIDAVEAASTLTQMGLLVAVNPRDVISQPPEDLSPVPVVYVDMASNPEAIAPKGIQCVSQVYEAAYYPTADDIVEAVCRKLGREYHPQPRKIEEPVVAGGPF